MSVSLPVRSHPSQPESSYSREDVIAAIQEFYEILIKLPYVSPSALVLPPTEGWSGVNAEELRRRGKTEEVIEFLRRLPYLRALGPYRRWMIGPDTIEIAYCDGEVYEEWIEEVQPIPGHCIWLTDHDSRDGLSLIFDTKTGTITEFAIINQKIMLDYEDYEKLTLHEKWMAYATMPATAFFGLWKRRFEKLFWIALYYPKGNAGTAQWYTYEDEEDMLASDDDYDPGKDEIEEVDSGGEESGSEDSMNNEDDNILEDEVDGLMDDAGEESYQRRMELWSQRDIDETEPIDLALSETTPQRPDRLANWKRKRDEIYAIHKSHGWPSSFDRDKCRVGLAEFLVREERSCHSSDEVLFEERSMTIS